jgi:hypothetical protein
LTRHEGLSTTSHARLFIAQQERVAYETLALGLRALESASRTGDEKTIIDVLCNFVPSYQPWSRPRDGATDEQSPQAVSAADWRSPNGRAVASGNGHSDKAAHHVGATS